MGAQSRHANRMIEKRHTKGKGRRVINDVLVFIVTGILFGLTQRIQSRKVLLLGILHQTAFTPTSLTQAIDATADVFASARTCLTLLSAPIHVVQCLVCCCSKQTWEKMTQRDHSYPEGKYLQTLVDDFTEAMLSIVPKTAHVHAIHPPISIFIQAVNHSC